ncbi:hypothetical protein [Pseudoalteromonas sp. T1lg21]|uniref:hypothetical protein n=1 Tax=Pseudoalteromonas sp. T1lg21 TaxID=2077095 RepID=UPI000CF61EE9|nr:hypothetical protein [Pseudoalteromonas sp. T1lg21]
MNIEVELIDFLEKNIKETTNKSRNINIIAYYYGFRGSDWPTYEETAKRFDVGTRERIRQLLNENFRDFVEPNDFPSIKEFQKILNSKNYWKASDLEEEISSSRLVRERFSVKGILNLLDDLGVVCGFEIYTPELNRTSRNSLALYENNFIIKASELKKIKSFLKKAQGLPGRCGIANLNYLKGEVNEYYDLVSQLIINSYSSWTKKDEEGFWYIYENRDNTIINYSEKLFSIISECNADRLALVYRNALDGRSYKYPYPPEKIIKEYLKSSVFFENDEGNLKFIGETKELNDIEKDVAHYLGGKKSVSFPDFRSHLRSKGYGDPHIQKATSSSPLVYVDKSGGRTHYTYSLTNSKVYQNQSPPAHGRYQEFLIKLRKLLAIGTDETLEQKIRREQRILQDWLFKDKKQEKCAICNKTYSVNTLVTAHKKKRSECNDAERTDPYIVMPICLMGCDYFYEKNYVIIEHGFIRKGVEVEDGAEELKIIQELIGNKIDSRWLKGSSSYFKTSR